VGLQFAKSDRLFTWAVPFVVSILQGCLSRIELDMAKKTGMSDSSLWIIAVVLVAVAAYMYFR
jgi:hypothetical protein